MTKRKALAIAMMWEELYRDRPFTDDDGKVLASDTEALLDCWSSMRPTVRQGHMDAAARVLELVRMLKPRPDRPKP